MKTQLLTLAAALTLISTSSFAQLSSSPLEPGLYDFMKKSSNATLVNDQVMTVGATRVESVSPEQVTISGVVAKVEGKWSQQLERIIGEYNDRAAVGTMAYDAKSGSVVMYHNVNPKQVKLAEMSKVVLAFNNALTTQNARFSATLATK